MLYSETDPESYITEYTLVYEDNWLTPQVRRRVWGRQAFDSVEYDGFAGAGFRGVT